MISRDGCYDLDGNPLSMEEWMAYRIGLQQDPSEPWRVAYDEFDGFTVSTIWLGTDHHHPPRTWETVIFDGGEPGLQLRWTTREDAQKGHAVFVRILSDPAGRQTYREGFTTD